MVNKKYSDFEQTSFLLEDEVVTTQLGLEKNRKITAKDLFNQITSVLTNNAVTDCGVVKYIFAEHSAGQPINLPNHLVWCDGRTLLRSDNAGLVGTFIDFAYSKPTLRSQFNIPADKSSMKLPDLRDKHLVGSGNLNTIYSYASSKSVDFINGATASSSTTVSTLTGFKSSTITAATKQQLGFSSFNEQYGAPFFGRLNNRVNGQMSAIANNGNFFRVDSAYVEPGDPISFYANMPDHNHGASTSTSVNVVKNTALIDSINRVPAFALFPVLDINVNGLTLDPDNNGSFIINISDVVGLQDALNTKLNIVEFDTYKSTIYTKTEVDAKLGTKRSLHRQLTGLAGVVGGNSTIRPLNNMALASGLGFDTTTLVFNSGVNASIIELINPDLPIKELRYALRLVRSGTGNTQLEVGLHRVIDNIQVRTDTIQLTDTDAISGNGIILSYCNGSNDAFAVDGYYITLRNLTNTTLNFSSITLDIYVSLERE